MDGNPVKVGVAYNDASVEAAEYPISNNRKGRRTSYCRFVDTMDRDVDTIEIVFRINVRLPFIQDFAVPETRYANLAD
jgi:hypothetical protein